MDGAYASVLPHLDTNQRGAVPGRAAAGLLVRDGQQRRLRAPQLRRGPHVQRERGWLGHSEHVQAQHLSHDSTISAISSPNISDSPAQLLPLSAVTIDTRMPTTDETLSHALVVPGQPGNALQHTDSPDISSSTAARP